MGDPDTTLFPSLLASVRIGFGPAIPPSGLFPTKAAEPLPNTPLSVHLSNWQSAEQNIQLTRELVAEELDKGSIFKYPGTLEQAQQEYPMGVSVGRLGIATSDSRPPRLVVDSSVCGLNSRCVIPEKSTLPSDKELIRSFPCANCSRDFHWISRVHTNELCYILKNEAWSDSAWMVNCISIWLPPLGLHSVHLGGQDWEAGFSVHFMGSFGSVIVTCYLLTILSSLWHLR